MHPPLACKILKHYNQPRIESTQMKLTQKVDHFTVFESFPSTIAVHGSSHQQDKKKLAGWICEVVLGMFTLDGQWGMKAGKGYSSKLW